jgi:hypothetical protein
MEWLRIEAENNGSGIEGVIVYEESGVGVFRIFSTLWMFPSEHQCRFMNFTQNTNSSYASRPNFLAVHLEMQTSFCNLFSSRPSPYQTPIPRTLQVVPKQAVKPILYRVSHPVMRAPV